MKNFFNLVSLLKAFVPQTTFYVMPNNSSSGSDGASDSPRKEEKSDSSGEENTEAPNRNQNSESPQIISPISTHTQRLSDTEFSSASSALGIRKPETVERGRDEDVLRQIGLDVSDNDDKSD